MASAQNDGEQPARQRMSSRTKMQLAIVFMIMFAEPITGLVVYPFTPEFVRRTGVTKGDEKRTGYYAGIIESMFFVMESLTVVLWARLSDYVGRRPVVVLGPAGLAIATLAFGLSDKFAALVFFRGVQGVFNGNVGLCKTIMAEITDSTNRAEAFSYMPMLWSVAVAIAHAMGGLLSNPADKWPETMGKIQLLRVHPYFLPCLVAASVAFISFMFAILFLEESSTVILSKRDKRKRIPTDSTDSTTGLLEATDGHEYGTVVGQAPQLPTLDSDASTLASNSAQEERPPTLRELFKPRFTITLISYGFFSFCDMSYSALIPLFYSTSIHNGGLGFSPFNIGAVLGTMSLFALVFQLTLSARILRRFGSRDVFVACFGFLSIAIGSLFVLSLLVRHYGEVNALLWAVIVLQMGATMLLAMAYASIHLLIIDSAPTPVYLASTNSVAQMTACAVRAFAPTIASSLFSASLEQNLLGGRFAFVALLGLVAIASRVAMRLPKQPQHP